MENAGHLSTHAVHESLEWSAPWIRRVAAVCCRKTTDAGVGCESYHGLWPYLRLMGLGKTLSGQGPRFVAAVRDWATHWPVATTGQSAQILVSGSADQSMLAHVLHALRDIDTGMRVTVLDLCETPLKASQWYAQHVGFENCTTACSDMLTFRPPQAMDLIVTSSFLGYFDPLQREALFRRYAEVMTPGGWLVFANRLRPGPQDRVVGFSSAQALAFVEAVEHGAAGLAASSQRLVDDLVGLARNYVASFASYPLNGPDDVQRLAAHAGLEVVTLDQVHNVNFQHKVSGPSTNDASPYVFAILRKPQN